MNMYLEKLAANPGLIRTALTKGVKVVGTTLNRAMGGTHRSYAISKGITDPIVLSRINGSEEGQKALYNALGSNKGHPLYRKIHLTDSLQTRATKNAQNKSVWGKDQVNYNEGGHFDMLQKQTRNARIATAAVAGGSYLGYHKIKDKISEKYNQPTYQYNY